MGWFRSPATARPRWTNDRIEKSIQLGAPPSRVWRALTDSAEFGEWFGARFDGPFRTGEVARGQVTHPGYERLRLEATVTLMDEDRAFAFTWHPYAVDPKYDYSREEPTRVEFRLAGTAGGTLLTLTESGFRGIPAARREEAFRLNACGWAAQLKNIERHLA